MRSIIAVIKIFSFFFLTLLFCIVIVLFRPISQKTSQQLFFILFTILIRLVDIEVNELGNLTSGKSILFVSNHTSFLDILLLGHRLKTNFIAKKEVGQWPLIGWITIAIGTICIERNPKGTREGLNKLIKGLESGRNYILFPEGTTGPGNNALPFKSSFFNVAEELNLTIQPIAITYTHINGRALTPTEREAFSWTGDKTLISGLYELFYNKHIRVDIKFLEPVSSEKNRDRKILAKLCESAVSKAIGDSIKAYQ